MRALVILSGGQDSTTALFWALKEYGAGEVAAVTFDYGQRHRREISAATKVADMARVPHYITTIGPILKGTSPLTDQTEPLETYQNFQEMDRIIGDRIEKTFVPMRNAVFLTIAANHAVALECNRLVTGVCQQDNANYPDCRAYFIDCMMQAVNAALGYDQERGNDDVFEIDAPLIHLTKAESIYLAQDLPGCMEAMAYTHTAYDGMYPPVSKDHASVLRAQGFVNAGVPDPLVIRAVREGLMPLPDTPNYDGVR